jgi:hypothetical protein
MTASVSSRVRQQVRRRAKGRCEYCLVHEEDSYVGYQIDHIMARKHGGARLHLLLDGMALTSLGPFQRAPL